MQQTITLRGLHVVVHTPTEERLSFQVEGLSPEVFKRFSAELEDFFEVVDSNYKEVKLRGRGWKARGHKVENQERTRILKFSPFPSRFSNILRTIRKDLYCQLHANCIVLEGEKTGGYSHNIYLLPYSTSAAFMTYLEKVNSTLDELQTKIEAYKTTWYYHTIKQLLEKYHVYNFDEMTWHIGHVEIDATPLSLEPTTIKEVVDKEYKEMFERLERDQRMTQQRRAELREKLQKEYETGTAALQRELVKKRSEIIDKSLKNLQSKIDNIVNMIVSIKRDKNIDNIKSDLEYVRKIAVSIGLEAVATSIIDPLAEVVDDPTKATVLFGTKNLTEGVSGRVAGLFADMVG